MGKAGIIGCLGLLLLAAVLFGVWAMGGYNRLVGLEEDVNQAWAEVENAYQRRSDLIPNLVETVKGARDFEQETFTAVAEARSRAGQVDFDGPPNAQQLEQFQQAQDGLSSALSRLLVTVERYPELRATEAFRDLQAQLEGTENRIAVARKRFNESAQAFNTTRRRFPTNIVASLFGFEERPYFESTEGSETPPAVDFGAAA